MPSHTKKERAKRGKKALKRETKRVKAKKGKPVKKKNVREPDMSKRGLFHGANRVATSLRKAVSGGVTKKQSEKARLGGDTGDAVDRDFEQKVLKEFLRKRRATAIKKATKSIKARKGKPIKKKKGKK